MESRLSVIDYLESNSDLITLFLEDLARYKKLAHEAASKLSVGQADLTYMVFHGKGNHSVQVGVQLPCPVLQLPHIPDP